VINCAGREIPNHWEQIGVSYLTYPWLDVEEQVILDPMGEVANQTYDFIESALKKTESVLVSSYRGQSRASTIIAAYLMRRYSWSLLKTLEFLDSRRPDLEIRTSFINQLQTLE